jgi:uncharacterized membrane protein
VIDLDFGMLGWLHLLASVAAMAAFLPAMLVRKGSPRHRASGKMYAIAYAALSVTSLGIYGQQRFWFPHWLALAGLAVLAVGYLAVRAKPRGWRYLHFVAMLLSAYNLFGGAVNELFLRVAPLRAIAGPSILASPVVGMTHGIVMMAFVVLILFYVVTSLFASRSSRVPSADPAR